VRIKGIWLDICGVVAEYLAASGLPDSVCCFAGSAFKTPLSIPHNYDEVLTTRQEHGVIETFRMMEKKEERLLCYGKKNGVMWID
jgi:hypothetical protein